MPLAPGEIMSDIRKDLPEKQYSWVIGFFYLILLLIALSWTNTDLVEPNRILRYTFLICFVLPLFRYPNLAPAMFTLFITIRFFSISPFGYLPSKVEIYFRIALILYFFHFIFKLKGSKTNILLLILFFSTLFSNLLNQVAEPYGPYEYNFIRYLLIAIIMGKFLQNIEDVRLIEWSFIIISFCLSIYGLIFYQEFALNAIDPHETERVSWNDPNYLGCVIAIGIVISFYYLLSVSRINKLVSIFVTSTIILGFINLGMFASRGAFLTVALPILYLLYKRVHSLKGIITALIILGLFVFGFMTFSIFDSLIGRFSDETIVSGSGRMNIWKQSIETFSNLGLSKLLLGGGGTFAYQMTGESVGVFTITSPHNNYLEILYDYGIIGLISFVSLLIYWFKLYSGNELAVSLIILLVVSSLTLSPLMYLPFWFLVVLIENQKLKVV